MGPEHTYVQPLYGLGGARLGSVWQLSDPNSHQALRSFVFGD